MHKISTPKNIWTEDWSQGKVVLWRDNPAHPSARVFLPVNPLDAEEVIHLIEKIQSLRTATSAKTTKELREIHINTLRDSVRLGQIARQLDAVNI
jgi:hypothetical protein